MFFEDLLKKKNFFSMVLSSKSQKVASYLCLELKEFVAHYIAISHKKIFSTKEKGRGGGGGGLILFFFEKNQK